MRTSSKHWITLSAKSKANITACSSLLAMPRAVSIKSFGQPWDDLREGKYVAAEFKRYAKDAKEVWIQASYNPIMDLNGQPLKVVKFATDTTLQMEARTEAGHLTQSSMSNISEVTSAASQLLSSITEISQNMSWSNQEADGIVSQTDSANQLAVQLRETSESMERGVGIIRDIAEM